MGDQFGRLDVDPMGTDPWSGTLTGPGVQLGLLGAQSMSGTVTNGRTGQTCEIRVTCWVGGIGASARFGSANFNMPDGPTSGGNLDSVTDAYPRIDVAGGLAFRPPGMPVGVGLSGSSVNGVTGGGVSRGLPDTALLRFKGGSSVGG
jgi:hypothetical protein